MSGLATSWRPDSTAEACKRDAPCRQPLLFRIRHALPIASAGNQKQIIIVSHCNLFYWWPVWAIGFLLALLSLLDGARVAFVPSGTKGYRDATVQTKEIDIKGTDVLVPPKDKHFFKATDGDPEPMEVHMAQNKSYGVIFVIVLLLVILITNVPLRGLWSFIVLIVVIFLSIIFAIMDWWEPIMDRLGRLHIHMNLAGYFLFSLGLFTILGGDVLPVRQAGLHDLHSWAVAGLPGNRRWAFRARHHRHGDSKAAQRSVSPLGLGAGIGRLDCEHVGRSGRRYDLPNVLFIGYKVKMIEAMLREKSVVQAG